MDINWWRFYTMGLSGDDREPRDGCAAERLWRNACNTLVAPDAEKAWNQIVETSTADDVWHSLRNCVAYQAGVWQNLVAKGIDEVMQPAGFKLAIVLRHTPTSLTVKLLTDLLPAHPQSKDIIAYVLALLTDDEGACATCHNGNELVLDNGQITIDISGTAPTPVRDLQLFGDCELAVMAGSKEEYDAHAKLVRAEYAKLSQPHYVELRLKILNQLVTLPKLYHTTEFECFETAARENIEREICTLQDHLMSTRQE